MNLVIQGSGAGAGVAAEAAALTGAACVEQRGRSFRLIRANIHPALEEFCEARQLDYAYVQEGRAFAEMKLVATDMDSTLITVECIDELGGMLGIKDRIADITAAAMRGELDYPASLRRRVALLAGMEVSVLQRVYDEKLRLSPGAETLVAACKRNRIRILLVSGGFTFFTDKLKARLGLDYTLSNTLEMRDGKLTGGLVGPIVDAEAKAKRFVDVMHELGAMHGQTLAIGDGANDLKMMAEAGVSIAYRAKPVVREQATYALTHSGLDGVLNLFD